MSSTLESETTRTRKQVEDAAVFGVATAGAVYMTLAMGVACLGVGCVLLSVAAAVVIARESGTHDPGSDGADEGRLATDGGPREE